MAGIYFQIKKEVLIISVYSKLICKIVQTKSVAFGSLTGGPFTVKWEDHPDFTLFSFSTSSAETWSAIGLSSDQSMVKLYFNCCILTFDVFFVRFF